MSRVIQLKVPPAISLDHPSGWDEDRGTISVLPAGKPPKLRFRPGLFIEHNRQLYLIVYAYRLQDNPQEWLYCCEMRDTLRVDMPSTVLPGLTEIMGAGTKTPRVVKELFRNWQDATQYFNDIPVSKDRTTIPNGDLVRGQKNGRTKVISSGEVLDANKPVQLS